MTLIRTIEGAPTDYSPGASSENRGGGRISVDPSSALRVRGAILTDEGGYRANFSGNTLLYGIGTCTFTNGSNVVTGTGFSGEHIHVNEYIKLDADDESYLSQIASIIDDTTIHLYDNYTGTSATGAASVAIMKPWIGDGTSYTVVNGSLSIMSGTTSGSVFEIERDVDYTPIIKQTSLAISQRAQNQTIHLGLYDEVNAPYPRYWCWFKFTGTDNTFVACESAYDRYTTPTVYETETTLVKLPFSLNTSIPIRYRIEALVDKVRFLVNGQIVAEHFKSIPSPYALLTSVLRVTNDNTVGVSTTMYVDYDSVQNFNKVMSAPINDTDPAPASTVDMESMVNLLTQLVSRTPYPDALGRVRTAAEVTASTVVTASNLSTNVAQVAGQTTATGLGVAGNGVARTTMSSDSFSAGPSLSIGAQLPLLYNNILVS